MKTPRRTIRQSHRTQHATDVRLRGLLVLALLVLCVTGCISRTLQVKSDPPGAWVYLNGEELGKTPVTHFFTHSGPRKIVVSLQGYKPAAEVIDLDTPWWGYVPLDLFAELWPGDVVDRHKVSYELAEAEEAETDMDELLRNLDKLRQNLSPVEP